MAADTVSGTQSITGNSTLVQNMETLDWVSSVQNPINVSSGILMINSTGNLVLSQKSGVVWSSNPTKPTQNQILQLLDSGNLVVRDGMKLGWKLKTGLQRRLVSWKSSDDPSPGDLTWELRPCLEFDGSKSGCVCNSAKR
ncbi:hypothetical protein FEM48_Zijuj01G0213600 [Ziziphus jujuba var. spinosa]|uniref:Bulb-type lectin domain-containing protein n=1 Tax=Ziziphus jujuba var. spinosa TaxID=714518 RepID=A0A978W3M5_ZIZJJ|nr:hypothetical protein FEM48_Zijuj01G0213600 [Ziziphus jujuba var. spinosa]